MNFLCTICFTLNFTLWNYGFVLHGDTWKVSSHHQMCLMKVDDLHKKSQKVHGQFSIVCSSKGKKARQISFGKFNPCCMVSL